MEAVRSICLHAVLCGTDSCMHDQLQRFLAANRAAYSMLWKNEIMRVKMCYSMLLFILNECFIKVEMLCTVKVLCMHCEDLLTLSRMYGCRLSDWKVPLIFIVTTVTCVIAFSSGFTALSSFILKQWLLTQPMKGECILLECALSMSVCNLVFLTRVFQMFKNDPMSADYSKTLNIPLSHFEEMQL